MTAAEGRGGLTRDASVNARRSGELTAGAAATRRVRWFAALDRPSDPRNGIVFLGRADLQGEIWETV